jgi:Domain of unknown function (DUF4148)
MNPKLLAATVIALSSLGATASFADTFEVITPNTNSTTSRAEVMADYARSRADGSLPVSDNVGEFKFARKANGGNVNRAEVRKEGVKALAARTNYSVSLTPRAM